MAAQVNTLRERDPVRFSCITILRNLNQAVERSGGARRQEGDDDGAVVGEGPQRQGVQALPALLPSPRKYFKLGR